LAQFFDMGGYAVFVWSAWAVVLVVLGGMLAVTLIQRDRVRRTLAARGLMRRTPD
jgi:heme exporter protein CcmD